MRRHREFHFQEGFTGEAVTLAVNGKPHARFDTRTQLQVGLARIEKLELDAGQVVTIAVPSLALREDYQVDDGDRWITVNRVDGALVVRLAQSSPGYV